MLRTLLIAAAVAASACVGGTKPAACAIDTDCGSAAFCSEGSCFQGTRTCPVLKPSLSSINDNLFQVGCGVGQRNCHASDSAVVNSGPSFAGNLYKTLVNAPAANRLGTASGLILVTPGDPGNSFLLRKLRLHSASDPQFGSGQPADAPGSTCEAAVATIEQWIQNGAPND